MQMNPTNKTKIKNQNSPFIYICSKYFVHEAFIIKLMLFDGFSTNVLLRSNIIPSVYNAQDMNNSS